jgi:hypothetical protein
MKNAEKLLEETIWIKWYKLHKEIFQILLLVMELVPFVLIVIDLLVITRLDKILKKWLLRGCSDITLSIFLPLPPCYALELSTVCGEG